MPLPNTSKNAYPAAMPGAPGKPDGVDRWVPPSAAAAAAAIVQQPDTTAVHPTADFAPPPLGTGPAKYKYTVVEQFGVYATLSERRLLTLPPGFDTSDRALFDDSSARSAPCYSLYLRPLSQSSLEGFITSV